MRELPQGKLTIGQAWVSVLVAAVLFILAAWQINPLCGWLSPVALLILFGYSYTKRFTWASHLVLGLSLAGAPLGAWIAVRGDVTITPILLALAVLLWVAGFDVLYALQDLDFDRTSGLYSIPARFGLAGSLWISGVLHALMLGVLALLPRFYPPGLGMWYWLGWAGCALLIAYQHWVVRPRDLSRLNAAFFTANGVLSAWLFAWTALDILRP
jgi:4-hydroxybenzoate polyprenyltransferase